MDGYRLALALVSCQLCGVPVLLVTVTASWKHAFSVWRVKLAAVCNVSGCSARPPAPGAVLCLPRRVNWERRAGSASTLPNPHEPFWEHQLLVKSPHFNSCHHGNIIHYGKNRRKIIQSKKDNCKNVWTVSAKSNYTYRLFTLPFDYISPSGCLL